MSKVWYSIFTLKDENLIFRQTIGNGRTQSYEPKVDFTMVVRPQLVWFYTVAVFLFAKI